MLDVIFVRNFPQGPPPPPQIIAEKKSDSPSKSL